MFKNIEAPQDDLILTISHLLEQASYILQEEYVQYCNGEKFDIDHKSDKSPVTQADLKTNTFIETALAQLTPNLPVISEENKHTQRRDWSTAWLLDPLDGTKEFLHQRPEFTINLSQICDGKTIFSAIAVPMKKVIYLSKAGTLPFKYDWENNVWQIYVDDELEEDFKRNKVLIGLSHRSQKKEYLEFIQKIENFRSVQTVQAGSAYKFCLMLEGEIDIYPRFHPTYEWDTSAGQGLLESIGGALYSLSEQDFTYNQRDTLLNQGFIATRSKRFKSLIF